MGWNQHPKNTHKPDVWKRGQPLAEEFDDALKLGFYYAFVLLIWDEWPQFFRGRLRVIYELTGRVNYQPRGRLPWNVRQRRARLWEGD